MSWGRIDDAFTSHPKILALKTKARKWTWLEILAYTWKHDSPLIPDEIDHVIPAAKAEFVDDCETLGLVERDRVGRRRVNDWELYSNKTVEEKVAAFLAKHPEAGANEVARVVGGRRELVLSEVAKRKEQSQNGGSWEPHLPCEIGTTPPVPGNRQNGHFGGSHARAPGPNPTPEEQVLGPSSVSEESSPSPVASYVAREPETAEVDQERGVISFAGQDLDFSKIGRNL